MRFYKARKNFVYRDSLIAKNELITEKELEKHYKNINMDLLEIVEIKKNNTYKIFGVRFENVENLLEGKNDS